MKLDRQVVSESIIAAQILEKVFTLSKNYTYILTNFFMIRYLIITKKASFFF